MISTSFNYNKLRGRIIEKFKTQDSFAAALKIGRVSLSQRLNNKLNFSQSEIMKSVELLNVPREEIPTYFLTNKFRKANERKDNNMTELQNSKTTLSSLEVAEMLETEHKRLLRKLEGGKDRKGYIQIMTEAQMVPSDYFLEDTYKDASGKENRCYQFTKLGCDFIANKFTGEKGVLFTAKYVKRFQEMQTALLEYKPKMTSLGEVASYIKITSRYMEKQGCTPSQIMQMIDDINKQFGINLPKLAKVNPWEQMTIICIQQ